MVQKLISIKILLENVWLKVTTEVIEEVVDDETGEITEATKRVNLLERDHELTEDNYGLIKESGLKTILIQKISSEESERSVMMNTLRKRILPTMNIQHLERFISRYVQERCRILKLQEQFLNAYSLVIKNMIWVRLDGTDLTNAFIKILPMFNF